MFHSQLNEGYFPPGFTFRFAVQIKISFIVIIGGIAFPAKAKIG